jgi:hypothetical protein
VFFVFGRTAPHLHPAPCQRRRSRRFTAAAPHGLQENYGSIAEYYDASWLSFRNAYWRLGNFHAEGYNASDFYVAGAGGAGGVPAGLPAAVAGPGMGVGVEVEVGVGVEAGQRRSLDGMRCWAALSCLKPPLQQHIACRVLTPPAGCHPCP